MLDSGLLIPYYTTKETLIAGSYYIFKVNSRNSVGFSEFATSDIIMAASVPYPPINVITMINVD